MRFHWGKTLLFVAVVVAIFAAIDAAHFASSKATLARYRAQLLARGEKLKMTEIAVAPSTNEEFIAARQVLSRSGLITSPALIVDLTKYIAPGKARVAWRGELDLGVFPTGTNTTAPTWESFISQAERTEPGLRNVREALDNCPPDIGWKWQDDFASITNWPGRTFVRDRYFAQALYNAAIVDLRESNLDAGITNLHALVMLTRLNRNEPVLVSQMIRIAITQSALSTTWETLQAPGWDEPRLTALQRDLEQMSFIDGLEMSFEAERAFGQARMTKLRNSSFAEMSSMLSPILSSPQSSVGYSGPPLLDGLSRAVMSTWQNKVIPAAYRASSINEDELFQLKTYTKTLDAVRLLKQGHPWPEVATALTNATHEMEETLRKDAFGRLIVSRAAIPNFERAVLIEAQTETRRNLAIAAIAIKRFQLTHGTAPPSLAALAPQFLATVPVDPMSSKPLCYHSNPDGSFALYSTGQDGVDDGGDATPPKTGGKPGLWEGRDAVWPMAATPEEQAAEDGAHVHSMAMTK